MRCVIEYKNELITLLSYMYIYTYILEVIDQDDLCNVSFTHVTM